MSYWGESNNQMFQKKKISMNICVNVLITNRIIWNSTNQVINGNLWKKQNKKQLSFLKVRGGINSVLESTNLLPRWCWWSCFFVYFYGFYGILFLQCTIQHTFSLLCSINKIKRCIKVVIIKNTNIRNNRRGQNKLLPNNTKKLNSEVVISDKAIARGPDMVEGHQVLKNLVPVLKQ